MDQWVWDYIQRDSVVERNDPKSRRDISLDIAYSATDDNFRWYDHPDTSGSFRKTNVVAKVYNGKKYCQVEFHLIQQLTAKGYEVHWGPGLFH